MTSGRGFPTFDIKGVSVAAVNLAFASDFVCARATKSHGEYVTVTGAHGIVEATYDERIRLAHQQACMVVPDGMPLVWLGKSLGFRSMSRVRGADLMERIFSIEQSRHLSHFFYGADPAVIGSLCEVLGARFGQFNLVGVYSPPMRPLGFLEQNDVLARIRDLKPDLIWVSLSTPKQELWMQMHMPKIGSGIAIGVGAAFHLVSGTIFEAPRVVQNSGLEWLFRLAMEPRRLYRRYALVVPKFSLFLLEAFVTSRFSSRDLDR